MNTITTSLNKVSAHTLLAAAKKTAQRASSTPFFSNVFTNGRKPVYLVGLVVLLIALFLIGRFLLQGSDGEVQGDARIEIAGPKASQYVNTSLKIEVNDELTPVDFTLVKAELRDQIAIQKQLATSVKGRTFLVLTLKLVNENNTALSFNTKNFVRLSVNGNEEDWFAPTVHNDPVEVQAQSTKETRVGFTINDDDSSLVLRVGKLDGDKERVELSLQ